MQETFFSYMHRLTVFEASSTHFDTTHQFQKIVHSVPIRSHDVYFAISERKYDKYVECPTMREVLSADCLHLVSVQRFDLLVTNRSIYQYNIKHYSQ